jgi:hypothetical protein
MKQQSDFETFIAELEKDRYILTSLLEENKKAYTRIEKGSRDNLDYAALAYTLHNVYCLLENYFLRIAKFFENNLDSATWHKDLVRRMTIEIRDVRPALLDDNTAEMIDELRSFRHVFRNLYQSKLKPDRVLQVNTVLAAVIDPFFRSHDSFIKKLRTIGEAVEN